MNASPKRFLVFSGLASQKPVWASSTNVPSFIDHSFHAEARDSPAAGPATDPRPRPIFDRRAWPGKRSDSHGVRRPSRRLSGASLVLQDVQPGVVVGDVHDRVAVDEHGAALDDP